MTGRRSDDRSRVVRPRPGAEVALVAATLVGAAGMVRLLAGGVVGGAAGPVLVAALAGALVPAALARSRWSGPESAVVSTGAVLLVTTWTTVGAATRWGVPTGTTLRDLRADLVAAHRVLALLAVPVPTVPGVVFLTALLAGEAALVGRVVLGWGGRSGRGGRPALALLPSFGLVAWSAGAEPGWSAAALVACYAVTGGATVLSGDRWPRPHGAHGRSLVPAVALGAAAAMALVTTAAVGVPSTGAAGAPRTGSGNDVPVSGLVLSTDLLAVERQDPDTLLFTAETPVPTYWQVAALTRFVDDRWVPGPRTSAVLGGATPVSTGLPAGVGVVQGTFVASVMLRGLTGRLVPVPPTAVSMAGDGSISLSDVGAVAEPAAGSGTTYTVLARIPQPVGGESQAPGGPVPASVAADMTLPPLPPVVGALARSVVAGVPATPLARAEALVNWFRSAAFRYTLTPPAAPAGSDPLVRFLTVTRAGSCEDFAGAFAVLARTLGIPTRVAVGFTAGSAGGGYVTKVLGADAHAWPEVYLGSAFGWVSFEPTPSQPSGDLTPPGVVGPTGVSVPPPPTTLPAPTTVPSVPPTTAAPVPPATAPPAAPVHGGGAGGADGIAVAVVVLAAGAGLVVAVAGRRHRRRRRASPATRVVDAWAEVDRALRRCGLPRPAARSPVAHAAVLERAVARPAGAGGRPSSPAGDELAAAVRDVALVAGLTESASYGAGPTGPDEVARAELLARSVSRALRSPAVRRRCRVLRPGDGVPAGSPV